MRLRYTLNNAIEGQHITTYSPKGWEDTEIVLQRHDQYDGVFKDFTIKVDFFCGAGKEYIDNIYDTQGIEAEVNILIEIDCEESGDYDTLYEGILMMKTYEKIQAAPEYTRVNLMQSGIIQTVLNRLETKVNLSALETLDGEPLTAFDFGPYEITLHSKMITKVSNLNFVESFPDPETPLGWTLEGSDTDNVDVFDGSGDRVLTHSFSQTIIPEVAVLNEVLGLTGAASSLIRSNDFPGDNQQIQGDNLYEVVNTLPETFIVSGKLRFGVRVDFDWITGTAGIYNMAAEISPKLYMQVGSEIRLLETKSTISGSSVIDSVADPTPPTSEVIPLTELSFEFEETFTEISNDSVIRVYLKFDSTRSAERPSGFGQSYNINMTQYSFFHQDYTAYEKSFIKVEQRSITADSTGYGFPVHEAGAQISRVITGQPDPFRSSFYGRKNSQPYAYDSNGCGSFISFMNGLQLRGFPIATSPVYMSMKDYIDGLRPLHNIGLGIKYDNGNHYILVEEKGFFYREEVVLTLNYITNFKTTIDEKKFFNLVNIGYSEWEKEGTNGLDEYNSKRQFALKNKQAGATLDLISPFVASPYSLELTRRKQHKDYPTEDTTYDNNIFIICLNRSVDGSGIPVNLDIAERDENFTNVQNILSPETTYNIRISPSRILRKHFNVISTSVIKSNATLKDIKFTYGEGNYRMISKGEDPCDPGNQAEINEGADVEVHVPNGAYNYRPIITGELDSFEKNMSKADYDLLNAVDADGVPNYYKQLQYSISDSVFYKGYIKEIRYSPIKGIASFKMYRAYDRTTCSNIYVEPEYVECGYVE